MFGVYDQLLKLDPITPQVRAAVFTDLARLPGVRSIGQVTDPLGRTGYGIALGPGPAGQEATRDGVSECGLRPCATNRSILVAPGSSTRADTSSAWPAVT